MRDVSLRLDDVLMVPTDVVRTGSTPEGTVLHWPSSGRNVVLSRRAMHLVSAFAVPASVADVAADWALDQPKRLALLDAVRALLETGALTHFETVSDSTRPSGRGLFGSAMVSLDQAVRAGSDVVVIGAPHDLGVSNRAGAKFAPAQLRRVSTSLFNVGNGARSSGMYDPHLGGQLLDGLRLTDVGDLITKHGDHGQSLLASLEDSVALVAGQGAMPLVLGGDHSITLSVVDGLLQHHDRLGVLHFDAHHDYGRVEVGTGGNLHHGNFLGWVLGRDGVKSVAQFGVRQRVVERPQESPKVRSWPGTSAVVKGLEHIVSSLPSGLKWHLTFDVDVLDPTVMPSTGTVLPDGLTYREAKSIVSGLCRELDVISMDFVEFIPAAEEWPAAVVCGLILDAVVSALDFPGSSSD